MMNVEAADLYVVKRPAARTDAVSENSNNRECHEKRNGRNQLAFAMTAAEMLAIQLLNTLPPSPNQAGKRKKGK